MEDIKPSYKLPDLHNLIADDEDLMGISTRHPHNFDTSFVLYPIYKKDYAEGAPASQEYLVVVNPNKFIESIRLDGITRLDINVLHGCGKLVVSRSQADETEKRVEEEYVVDADEPITVSLAAGDEFVQLNERDDVLVLRYSGDPNESLTYGLQNGQILTRQQL